MKKYTSLGAMVVLFALWAIIPVNAASQEEIDIAITDGVEWLVGQQHADGSWGWWNQVACTGFAVTKLSDLAVENGYDPLDEEYEYSDEIKSGLDFIFRSTNLETIDGDEVANWGPRLIYETSIAMMAIASTNAPDEMVTAGSPVDDKTYKQVVELGLSYLVHSQNPDGGWRYSLSTPLGEESDNSNTGYAVLGLIYAQNKFGIPIPESVTSGLNNFVSVIQNEDGSSKYTPTWDWRNILKTGNLLYELQILGYEPSDDRVVRAIGYIQNTWNDPSMDPGWQGNYQAMYTMMKGFESCGVEKITVDGTEVDWFDEVSTFIVDAQYDDGSWPSDQWGDSLLTTEWALLTLEKTVEIPLIPVSVDIKPGSCPNPLNTKEKGVIPVAILGTEEFDVTTIDESSIRLGLKDTIDTVSVAPIRFGNEDVATPFEGELCDCHELRADGFIDLTLKFDAEELVSTLGLTDDTGDVTLTVVGNLKEENGGTQIEGQDCVKILSKSAINTRSKVAKPTVDRSTIRGNKI